jgi:hypothetical protein
MEQAHEALACDRSTRSPRLSSAVPPSRCARTTAKSARTSAKAIPPGLGGRPLLAAIVLVCPRLSRCACQPWEQGSALCDRLRPPLSWPGRTIVPGCVRVRPGLARFACQDRRRVSPVQAASVPACPPPSGYDATHPEMMWHGPPSRRRRVRRGAAHRRGAPVPNASM